MERLPKLLDEAELIGNWAAPLEIIRTLPELNAGHKVPEWLLVQMVWMNVVFEQNILNNPESEGFEKSLEILKSLSCWCQVEAFDSQFLLLEQEYLSEQGVQVNISTLSQFLSIPQTKSLSPHRLFDIKSYCQFEAIDLDAHHPLVLFFRHSSGYKSKSPFPNLYFDCDWYRKTYLDAQIDQHPLLHYVGNFQKPNIQPSVYFYNDYVRKTQQLDCNTDPLSFYLKQLSDKGIEFRLSGFSPCPYFDREFYLGYPDLELATRDGKFDPFYHFCAWGNNEGRFPHAWLRYDMFEEVRHLMDFQTKHKVAVLVLGMHRSGTSALTGAMGLLGMDLPSHLVEGNSANETGYWESSELTVIHDQILNTFNSSWHDISTIPNHFFADNLTLRYIEVLKHYVVREFRRSDCFVLKDPRMCRLMPLWNKVLQDLKVDVKVIMPFRHPFEVAKSLQKRDGFLLEKSYLLWLRYVLEAERHSRGIKRCVVNYSRLLASPKHAIEVIALQCDMAIKVTMTNEEQINGFLDRKYYHQRIPESMVSTEKIPKWLLQVYEIFMEWSEGSDEEKILQQRMDNIADLLAQADGLFAKFIRE